VCGWGDDGDKIRCKWFGMDVSFVGMVGWLCGQMFISAQTCALL